MSICPKILTFRENGRYFEIALKTSFFCPYVRKYKYSRKMSFLYLHIFKNQKKFIIKCINVNVYIIIIIIILARTPEIGQGLGRILSCGARKLEQT